MVSYLLEECKLCVNISDDFGRTPLHDACWTAEPNFEVRARTKKTLGKNSMGKKVKVVCRTLRCIF
jgi:hypothetical protein